LWLISALSGTLEIEAEIESLRQDRERMRLENEKLDEIILQTRNETKQGRERMKLDRERMKQGRERMRLENEKLDEMILQTRNEIERLSELESKLDGLFSKYNINLGAPTKPQQ
jgi:chromosome segregation ATPase